MTMTRAHAGSDEPVRTCIGCRAKGAQSSMLRYGLRDGHVSPRIGTQHPHAGRSAYLCPQPRCLAAAVKRRAFTRSLSGPGGHAVTAVTDPGPLWQATLDSLQREIRSLERSAQSPQAHTRLIGLERLLFELSSQPPPSDRRATGGPGGQRTHG